MVQGSMYIQLGLASNPQSILYWKALMIRIAIPTPRSDPAIIAMAALVGVYDVPPAEPR
jgi:hypothetical protein